MKMHAGPFRWMRVVAVTALRLDARDDWLFDAGFAGYVVKPIDTDAFPDAVRRFIARGRG